jgi:hypothetical protein
MCDEVVLGQYGSPWASALDQHAVRAESASMKFLLSRDVWMN